MSYRIRIFLISLCFALAFFSAITYSFMFRTTDPAPNSFAPGNVAITYNGTAIFNNSNTPVFVRVRLVAYYKDSSGNIVGVASPDIDFDETNTTQNPFDWRRGANNTLYYP